MTTSEVRRRVARALSSFGGLQGCRTRDTPASSRRGRAVSFPGEARKSPRWPDSAECIEVELHGRRRATEARESPPPAAPPPSPLAQHPAIPPPSPLQRRPPATQIRRLLWFWRRTRARRRPPTTSNPQRLVHRSFLETAERESGSGGLFSLLCLTPPL
jgi:hypothetical protein